MSTDRGQKVRCQAVFLDAGGVIVVPHGGLVRAALREVGVVIDASVVPAAHYGAVRQLDRVSRDGDPVDYLAAFCQALGIPASRVQDAVGALSHLADRSRSGEILWSQSVAHARETMNRLRLAGIAVVVVTNSDGYAAENLRDAGICQTTVGPGAIIADVIDSRLVGSAKPDPGIFRAALQRADAEPSAVVHVGDMISTDVLGARAAGIIPIHLDPYGRCRARDHRHMRTLNSIWRHIEPWKPVAPRPCVTCLRRARSGIRGHGLGHATGAYDARRMSEDPRVFRRASAHGQTFIYRDSGQGPLVVLLHGFPDTPSGWDGTRAALNAAGYRTVVPYLRGYHPETIVSGRGYRREEIGEDPIRLLDALGEQRAVIVGHDWGAAITYGAATLEPERVRAVCAVAIPHPSTLKPTLSLLWGGRHFLTLRLPTGAWLARRADFSYLDTLIRRWAPRWSGPDRNETLRDVKRAFADPAVLDGALGYYRAQRPGGAPRLTQPALIVGGTTDIVPPTLFHQTPSYCENQCEVLIIDGAGHWPHRENAQRFERHLTAFLDGLE